MSNRKSELLGMSHGTASHRLRKEILFSLVQRLEEDQCYRCHGKIVSVKDLSIEHKVPWESASDPKTSFFDLDNISFSHLSCNVRAGARPKHPYCEHGHKLTEETTRVRLTGGRLCRYCIECQRRYNRLCMRKKRAGGEGGESNPSSGVASE